MGEKNLVLWTKMTITETRDGKRYHRFEFDTFDLLEEFFIGYMIGNPDMWKCSSKVIGKVLLVWDI